MDLTKFTEELSILKTISMSMSGFLRVRMQLDVGKTVNFVIKIPLKQLKKRSLKRIKYPV